MRPSSEFGDGQVAARATVTIVAAGHAVQRTAAVAAEMAGAVVGTTLDAGDGAASLGSAIEAAAPDILLLDIRTLDDAAADALLQMAGAVARGAPIAIVTAITEAQIDLAAALLFGGQVQHLCDPAIADLAAGLAAAAAAQRGRASRAGESSRDEERLRRLNDEVARIAETLARLTRDAGGDPAGAVATDAPGVGGADRARAGVRDISRGYGAPPAEDGAVVRAAEVRQAIRARRLRANFFDAELFADPAWDMLLDLFAAELEGASVSVSSLCIAACVPGTTALRWIASMTEGGLFDRQPDPNDRRRAFVVLTDRSRAAMRGYFASVKAQGLVPA